MVRLHLLLALLAAVYAFVAGIAAIRTRKPLLIKSARNAGIAVCVLVTLAVACARISFLHRQFLDGLRRRAQQPHAARILQIRRPLGRARKARCSSGASCFRSTFSPRCFYRDKHPELMPYVGVVLAGMQLFFLTLNNFVASPFQVLGAAGAGGALHWSSRGRRQRPQSAAAVSGDGDSPADAVSRLHRLQRFRSRLRWPRCSAAIRAKNGFTSRAAGP